MTAPMVKPCLYQNTNGCEKRNQFAGCLPTECRGREPVVGAPDLLAADHKPLVGSFEPLSFQCRQSRRRIMLQWNARQPLLRRTIMGRNDSIVSANAELARQINQEARRDPASSYAGKLVGIANGQVTESPVSSF